MKSLFIFVLLAFLGMISACDKNFIESRREGLRPYVSEEESPQKEEDYSEKRESDSSKNKAND